MSQLGRSALSALYKPSSSPNPFTLKLTHQIRRYHNALRTPTRWQSPQSQLVKFNRQFKRQYTTSSQSNNMNQMTRQQHHHQNHNPSQQHSKFSTQQQPPQQPQQPPQPITGVTPTNNTIIQNEARAEVEKVVVQNEIKAASATATHPPEPKVPEIPLTQSNTAKVAAPTESVKAPSQSNPLNLTNSPTPPTATPPPITTTTHPTIQPNPIVKPSRWKRRLKKTIIGLTTIILASQIIGNPVPISSYLHRTLKDNYIMGSKYESLYTYATESKHQYELTFKLDPQNLFHNLSIYQLLILKDVHTLYILLGDLSTLIDAINDRYEMPDSQSYFEWSQAQNILYSARSRFTKNLLTAEYICLKDTDPESYPELDQDGYYNKFKPLLHNLERSWCEVTAAKDALEQLLPMLEKYTTELLVIKARNRDAFESPEFLHQRAMNPNALPPVRIVPEIPYNQWGAIVTIHDQNLKELYKTYITKVELARSLEQNTKPLAPTQADHEKVIDDINDRADKIFGSSAGPDVYLRKDGSIGPREVKPELIPQSRFDGILTRFPVPIFDEDTPTQTLTRHLTPQQLSKREGLLRTSKKLTWKPLELRQIEANLTKFVDDQNALAREQLLAQKPNSEFINERKLRRMRQIEERYSAIKRQEKVQSAVSRVKLSAMLDPGLISVNDKDQMDPNSPLSKYIDNSNEPSFEDQIALLKNQLTHAELEAFNKSHPESAHIRPKGSRFVEQTDADVKLAAAASLEDPGNQV